MQMFLVKKKTMKKKNQKAKKKKTKEKKSKTEKTITKFQDLLRGVKALYYKFYRSHQIYKYSKVWKTPQ